MKKSTIGNTIKLTALSYMVAMAGMVLLVNSCSKSTPSATKIAASESSLQVNKVAAAQPLQQNAPETNTVTIAAIRKSSDGTGNEVMFNELAELFTVNDATVLNTLQNALENNHVVSVKTDPWNGVVLYANVVTAAEEQAHLSREIISAPGSAIPVDLATMNPDVINSTPGAMSILNTSTPGLTNVIPNMATAQLMFDYIVKQCCALPSPYGIDHCISFQYCQDGCYARAHKMCWILNNRYHYATHKIFSFANAGSDRLSVKCLKWGGCCVTWWYHVAPLVNIKTPTGVKAFVFDAAMFDQPVLLATWLHAQENPACSGTARVSMINIQPTTSYAPSGYSGLTFSTDPTYSSTNSTLISYSTRHTCY